MGGEQQMAVKTFMQRLIREGVVDPWEWPRLQQKWLEDILGFQYWFQLFGVFQEFS